MSRVPGDDVPRRLSPEDAPPFRPVPEVAETPDEAREIDYQARASIALIWLTAGYSIPIFVLALILA